MQHSSGPGWAYAQAETWRPRLGQPDRLESKLAEISSSNYVRFQAQIWVLALPPTLQANITAEWASSPEASSKSGWVWGSTFRWLSTGPSYFTVWEQKADQGEERQCVGAPSNAGVMGALLASEERGGTGPSRSSASEPWPYQNLCTWQMQHTSLPFGDRWTCYFPLAQSFPKFGSWDNFISDTK